jgi:hypothetical protein
VRELGGLGLATTDLVNARALLRASAAHVDVLVFARVVAALRAPI